MALFHRFACKRFVFSSRSAHVHAPSALPSRFFSSLRKLKFTRHRVGFMNKKMFPSCCDGRLFDLRFPFFMPSVSSGLLSAARVSRIHCFLCLPRLRSGQGISQVYAWRLPSLSNGLLFSFCFNFVYFPLLLSGPPLSFPCSFFSSEIRVVIDSFLCGPYISHSSAGVVVSEFSSFDRCLFKELRLFSLSQTSNVPIPILPLKPDIRQVATLQPRLFSRSGSDHSPSLELAEDGYASRSLSSCPFPSPSIM